MTGILGVLHSRSNSPRGQQKCSLPSKPSWDPSPVPMPNIRSTLAFRSRLLSDDYISRTPLPLGIRSKYFAYASPSWRSFSSNLRVMRKKNFVMDYYCMQMASIQTKYLKSPSKLRNIEEQIRSLHGKFVLKRLVDNAQDGEDVNGLLEDLREAVSDYMVRP